MLMFSRDLCFTKFSFPNSSYRTEHFVVFVINNNQLLKSLMLQNIILMNKVVLIQEIWPFSL